MAINIAPEIDIPPRGTVMGTRDGGPAANEADNYFGANCAAGILIL